MPVQFSRSKWCKLKEALYAQPFTTRLLDESSFTLLVVHLVSAKGNAGSSNGLNNTEALKYVQEDGGWKMLSDAQVKQCTRRTIACICFAADTAW